MDPEQMSDPLDDLADRYDRQEQEQTEARTEKAEPQTKAKPNQGAENVAQMTVKAMELGWRWVDSRVQYESDVYAEGREKLGPLFSKYGIGASSAGLPNSEELAAGWWLGTLAKRTWLGIKALWDADRKQQQQQDQNSNGDQRKSAAQQSAYPVPSEVGPREESMFEAQSPYPETGGEGGDVGHQQGP